MKIKASHIYNSRFQQHPKGYTKRTNRTIHSTNFSLNTQFVGLDNTVYSSSLGQ